MRINIICSSPLFKACVQIHKKGSTKILQPIRESAKVEVLPEAWGEVDRHVLMPLLKTVVLADVMQVVPSDDDGPLHLHLGHHTWKKVTT